MLEFVLPPDQPPCRAAEYLRAAGVSRTLWRKVLRAGGLTVNGRPAAAADLVGPGDRLSLSWEEAAAAGAPLTRAPAAAFPPIPLTVVYEDEHYLVVDKPAGLLVHPTSLQPGGTLADAVRHYLGAKNGAPLSGPGPGFYPVHRLDRRTSGLILIAKNPLAQHLLTSGQQRRLNRRYLGIAAGCIREDAGRIDAPIARRPGSIIERMVHASGQTAITHFRVLRRFAAPAAGEAAGAATLLELELETGRTHQIRVHLAHIGHPLLGDDLYGGPAGLIGRQALHAHRLSFAHPWQDRPIELAAPLPPDMRELVTKLMTAGR